ncbi:MAG: hypothetical protein AAFY71_07725 [Bacteroidota bacterium]
MHLDRNFSEAYMLDALSHFMEKEGYELLEAKKQFRKEDETGFQNVILSVSPYDDLVMIEFHFGIRIHAVEDMVGSFTRSLKGWRPDAHTIIISQGKLLDKAYWRFEAKSIRDLDEIVLAFQQMWSGKISLFLNQYFRLEGIHELLNLDPKSPSKYLPNQGHRYLRGLVVARLLQKENFEELVKIYSHQMAELPQGEILKPGMEKLVKYLRNISLN